MNEMKGINCCLDCANYSMKKHKCTICNSVETDARKHFYDDCPLPDVVTRSEYERVCRERDAAVGDLCLLKNTPFAGFCDICKNFGKENCRKCMESPEIDFPFYEWRGVQE